MNNATNMGYICPICHAVFILDGKCEHMIAQEIKEWNEKQQAIREAYEGLQAGLNLYYSFTGNNPHIVPSTGNDN